MNDHTEFIPTESYPTWMRRSLRATDWGALLALAFGILIALPLFWQSGLPRSNDSEHWVFQTQNIAIALSEGHLYPRWSPHALGGYGAPIPHYYPPAPAYAAALMQLVLTGSPVEAVRLLMALALCFTPLPVYALVARHSSAAQGLLASLLYAASPIVAFVSWYVLGDLPAVISYLLLPLLLWAVDRLLTAHQPLDIASVALLTAALLLTDLRFAAAAIVLAITLTVWHIARQRTHRWQQVLIALILGALCASFYWLPALLEINAVRWQPITETPTYIATFSELITGLRQIDPLNTTPPPQISLGLPLTVFLLPGVVAALRAPRHIGSLFLLAGILPCVFVTLSAPAQHWLIGVSCLCLAVGSSGAANLPLPLSARLRPLAFGLTCLIAISGMIPAWLSTRSDASFGDVSPAAQVRYELEGFGIAGLPRGWMLPTALVAGQPFNQTLLNSYTSGEIIKIDVNNLEGDAQVGFLAHTSQSDRLQIQTGIAMQIVVQTTSFPGWAASATAGRVELDIEADTGLLQMVFPESFNSDVSIALGSTPARIIGWAASACSLLILTLYVRRNAARTRAYLAEFRLLTIGEVRAASLVVGLSAVFVMLAVNGALSGLQVAPGSGLQGGTPIQARTEVGLEAAAFRVENPILRAGDTLEMTLYWRALRYLEENYRVQISLVQEVDNVPVFSASIAHPAQYPTRRWLTERYVTDRHLLQLPAVLSAGGYRVQVEVFDCLAVCDPTERLTFFDNQRVTLGTALILPIRIEIVP
jgi:hypothetical protein